MWWLLLDCLILCCFKMVALAAHACNPSHSDSLRQIVCESLSQKNTIQKLSWWSATSDRIPSKCEALSSNPSITKTKQKQNKKKWGALCFYFSFYFIFNLFFVLLWLTSFLSVMGLISLLYSPALVSTIQLLTCMRSTFFFTCFT
jgi:hypothetical protein